MSDPMTARDELKNTFTSYWEYLALRAACQLDLFDHIEAGSKSAESLSRQTETDLHELNLLLKAMETVGAIRTTSGGYALEEKGKLLTSSHPESLKNAAILWGGEQMNAWQNLDFTLKTGKPAFDLLYGKPFFDYLERHPEKLRNYHLAMDEYAREDYRDLGQLLDFAGNMVIMDVGGGTGALLKGLSKHFVDKKLILFDRPEVVLCAQELNGIQAIGGDFFASIPRLADTIILSRILHDWPDEKAIQILRNCHAALPVGGRLILIENMTEKIADTAALLSLNMAVICESFERCTQEYLDLLKQVGFRNPSQTKINGLQWAIISKK